MGKNLDSFIYFFFFSTRSHLSGGELATYPGDEGLTPQVYELRSGAGRPGGETIFPTVGILPSGKLT